MNWSASILSIYFVFIFSQPNNIIFNVSTIITVKLRKRMPQTEEEEEKCIWISLFNSFIYLYTYDCIYANIYKYIAIKFNQAVRMSVYIYKYFDSHPIHTLQPIQIYSHSTLQNIWDTVLKLIYSIQMIFLCLRLKISISFHFYFRATICVFIAFYLMTKMKE